MTNKKISALTAASTPLTGTELVPIVQSGNTDSVSVANLTVGRDVSMNKGTATELLVTGPGYIERTITLDCNTNDPGYNTVLKDLINFGFTIIKVEAGFATTRITLHNGDLILSTGNFVPSVAAKGINFTANTPAAGMTSQLLNWYEEGTWTPVGYYVRVGKLVTVFFTVEYPATANASAGRIGGLPFTVMVDALNPSGGSLSVNTSSVAAGVPASLQGTTLALISNPASGGSLTNNQLSNAYLRGFIAYMV
jgi:hypothetical protein